MKPDEKVEQPKDKITPRLCPLLDREPISVRHQISQDDGYLLRLYRRGFVPRVENKVEGEVLSMQ
jgi:hypothetical protein